MLGDTLLFHLFFFLFLEYLLCVQVQDVLMSISRRQRDRLSGILVDPRQLTLELPLCVAVGDFNALLPSSRCVAVSRLRSGRICRPRPGGPPKPSLWPVHWVPFGEVSPVGDPDYVRVAISWR